MGICFYAQSLTHHIIADVHDKCIHHSVIRLLGNELQNDEEIFYTFTYFRCVLNIKYSFVYSITAGRATKHNEKKNYCLRSISYRQQTKNFVLLILSYILLKLDGEKKIAKYVHKRYFILLL